MLLQDDLVLVILLVAGVCAPLAGWLAARRQRHPVVWFGFGAVLGPVGLVLLAAAPPGRCPACDSRIPGWAGWCPSCGTELGGVGTRLGAPPPRPVLAAPGAPLEAVPGGGYVAPLDAVVDRRSRRSRAAAALPAPVAAPSAVPSVLRDPASAALDATGPTAGEVLSTGVYLSGNARLEIGACYALSRVGDRWRVFGPVDAGQITIRHEGPLAGLQVTGMDDRIILRGSDGRSDVAIVLRSVGGLRPADLERVLGPDGDGQQGDSGGPGRRPDRGARGVAS